MNANLTSD
jgi:tetratricopeptide (TPR) repeat protein